MLLVVEYGRLVLVNVRIVKQTEAEFHTENVAYGFVDDAFLHLAFLDKFRKLLDKRVAYHFHVDTGVNRFLGYVLVVGCKAVVNHLAGRVPVGNDDTVKAPLAAKHVAEDEFVARRGHAVVVVERSHERSGSGSLSGLKRREIDVAQVALGDKRRVVVASALCGSVADEVLGAGSDGGRVVE